MMDRCSWNSSEHYTPAPRRPSPFSSHTDVQQQQQPYSSFFLRDVSRDGEPFRTSTHQPTTTRVVPPRSRREEHVEDEEDVYYGRRDLYGDTAWRARHSSAHRDSCSNSNSRIDSRSRSSSTGECAVPVVPLDVAEAALRQQCETTRFLARLLAGIVLQWRGVMLDFDAAGVPLRPSSLAAQPSPSRHSSTPRPAHAATAAGSAKRSASATYLTEELHFNVHACRDALVRGCRDSTRHPAVHKGKFSEAHPYNRSCGVRTAHTPGGEQRVDSSSRAGWRGVPDDARPAEADASPRSWARLAPAAQWVSYVVGDDSEDGKSDVDESDQHTRGPHGHKSFEDGVLYASLRRHERQRRHDAQRYRPASDSDGRRASERLCVEQEAVATDLEAQLRRSVLQGAARSADVMVHGMRHVQEMLKATTAAVAASAASAAATTAAASPASMQAFQHSATRRRHGVRTPESSSSSSASSPVVLRRQHRRKSHEAHTRQYAATAPLDGVTACARAGGAIYPAPPARGRLHIYPHHEDAQRRCKPSLGEVTESAAPQTFGRSTQSAAIAAAAPSPPPTRQEEAQPAPKAVQRKLDWNADVSGVAAALNGASPMSREATSVPVVAATSQPPQPPPSVSPSTAASPVSSLVQVVSGVEDGGGSSRPQSDSPTRRPLPPRTEVRERSRLLSTHAPTPTPTASHHQPALASPAADVLRESEAEARLRLVMEHEDAFVTLLVRYHGQLSVKAPPQQPHQQQRQHTPADLDGDKTSTTSRITTGLAPPSQSPSAASTLSADSDTPATEGADDAETQPQHVPVANNTRAGALQLQQQQLPVLSSATASSVSTADSSRLPPRRLPERRTGAPAAAAAAAAAVVNDAVEGTAVRLRARLRAGAAPLLSPLDECVADTATKRSRGDSSSDHSDRGSSSSSSSSRRGDGSNAKNTSHGSSRVSTPQAEARELALRAALTFDVPSLAPLLQPVPAHAAEAGVGAMQKGAHGPRAVATVLFPSTNENADDVRRVASSHGAAHARARPPLISPSPAAVATAERIVNGCSSDRIEVDSFSSVSSFHESLSPMDASHLNGAKGMALRTHHPATAIVYEGDESSFSPPPRNPTAHGAGG